MPTFIVEVQYKNNDIVYAARSTFILTPQPEYVFSSLVEANTRAETFMDIAESESEGSVPTFKDNIVAITVKPVNIEISNAIVYEFIPGAKND